MDWARVSLPRMARSALAAIRLVLRLVIVVPPSGAGGAGPVADDRTLSARRPARCDHRHVQRAVAGLARAR
jgi:hypothetical protein